MCDTWSSGLVTLLHLLIHSCPWLYVPLFGLGFLSNYCLNTLSSGYSPFCLSGLLSVWHAENSRNRS